MEKSFMKIAVISDIHGNKDALDAVFEDINAQECDMIFALGDYAMAGPQPSDLVNWFMERENKKNFKIIQGNTDYMIANYSEKLYEELKAKAPIMAEALKNDVETLNFLQKDFLKNLPSQCNIELDGVKFLLVHGSPRKNNEDILPDTPLKEVEKMVENSNADVILCGHTHIPCGFQTENKKTIVNVGSVGRPFTEKPRSCYLKITLVNGQCVFEHRFVDYNIEKAASRLRRRKFSGADKLADMLHNPELRHF